MTEPVTSQGSSVGKVVLTILLVCLGLFGLSMSLCGGFFSAISIAEFVTGKPGGEARAWSEAIIVMGGLSFIVGVIAIVLTVIGWKRLRGDAGARR